MSLLEVDGLVKRFGRRTVVNGVSFRVTAGEVVGLLGPNGAGKTTSFRMATGQIPPNGGAVVFNGEDVTGLPMYQRARRGMGYLSQEPSVFRKLTVEGNLTAILEALPRSRSLGRRLTKAERTDRTDEALSRFKLDHVRRNVAGKCSGGEKRRLEIARCLVCEPLLILLDEPFAAVDPVTTEDIRRIIRDLADAGIGILITDHNVREVFRTADRAYLISDGKVVTQGTPHELVNDQTAIDAYLGRSFEEDGFTRHFVARSTVSVSGSAEVPVLAPRVDRAGPGPIPARTEPGRAAAASPPAPATRVPTAAARQDPAPAAPPPEPAAPVRPVPPAYVPPLAFPQPAASPFADAGGLTPPARSEPAPVAAGGFRGAVAGLLGAELVRRAVEGLADDATVKAATVEVVGRGPAAVGPLLDALERRDPVLRRRAFEVLRFIAKEHAPLAFDPDAPDELRLRQVAHLRARIGRAA